MNPTNAFFSSATDEEPATPLDVPTIRARISAPCPGRESNTVKLGGRDLPIRNAKNVGTCLSYILFYDANGTCLGCWYLAPGEQKDGWLRWPPNASIVKFGCNPECGGTAILEFDDPNIA
ncbi:MAG: hypothetical protein WBL40_22810 [Terrimicrobiaceae bacterium]